MALFFKMLVTAVLALMLIIPLSAIQGVVAERQNLAAGVLRDIQSSGVGAQTLTGPILVVPYRRKTMVPTYDEKTKKTTLAPSYDNSQVHFLPEALAIKTRVGTEMRHRGIYNVLLYNAQQVLAGSFAVPDNYGLPTAQNVTYEWYQPHVLVGISDPRGIRGTPLFKWDGTEYPLKGGTLSTAIRTGVHAPLRQVAASHTYSFDLDLTLQGTERIDYVPVGKQTSIAMKSEWPHPSFFGQFLPESRTITAGGFDAIWRTTHLASGIEDMMDECLRGKCTQLSLMGVSFIEPVNVYLETQRAAKYGFLFVLFTFAFFQLFELMKKLAIHPVQYGLVGIALAMFFLLLTALAEHVAFVRAYAVAAGSCVALLGFYVSFVLRSIRRAAGFTAALSLLYGALYVLLQSEDLALLLGACLLFAILAAVMVITRKVDWHRLTARMPTGQDRDPKAAG
jgi:inner membrane protein